jgi:hypothetical protein
MVHTGQFDLLTAVSDMFDTGVTIATSVMTANADTFDLGELKLSQSIRSVKDRLAELSGVGADLQQLFIADDTREEEATELQDTQTLRSLLLYTEGAEGM